MFTSLALSKQLKKSSLLCLSNISSHFLALMAQTLLIDSDTAPITKATLDKNPQKALRYLIGQQSKGYPSTEDLHRIIRAVMSQKDNTLKQLFYYYLETVRDDKLLMMCVNQISKDLSSPNEYIRALVLRFISRLDDSEYLSYFLKDIVDNLTNKSAYVRLNAVACLTEISARFEIDAEAELVQALRREGNPEVLQVLFTAMNRLGIPINEFYRIALSETAYGKDVLLTLIKCSEDRDFLSGLLCSKHIAVVYSVASKLLRLSKIRQWDDTALLNRCTENIISIVQQDRQYCADFAFVLPFIRGHAVDLVEIISQYEQDLSRKVMKTAFENAETHEFVKLMDMISMKYRDSTLETEKGIKYKVLLLEGLKDLMENYKIVSESVLSGCLESFPGNDVALDYAVLKYMGACSRLSTPQATAIVDFLIETLSKIKYGKLFRLALDIISVAASKEQFEKLLDQTLTDFDSPPFYLSGESSVFLGAHLALSICRSYRTSWDCKVKTLGVLLKLMQFADKNNLLDSSSRSSITLCIRRIICDRETVPVPFDAKETTLTENETTFSVTSPLVFKSVSSFCENTPAISELAESRSTTVQLSGLGDPIYVEAAVKYSKYEIVLDLLLINQTESYLQDISFDFIFPQHISIMSKIPVVSLQAGDATTVPAIFSIREGVSCFISATASFKYPKQDEYRLFYIQNLSEISVEISEFLEGATVNFKELWTELEWENAYSVSIKNSEDSNKLLTVLNAIVAMCHGHLCNKLVSKNFLLGNIACRTVQGRLLLINLSMYADTLARIEVHVRGSCEFGVTSLSTMIANYLREYKE